MEEHVIYGPPIQDYNFSKLPLNVMIHQSLKEHRNKIAQIDAISKQQITFNDILNSSSILAHNLRIKGLNPGDIISIVSENRLEFVLPAVATIYIGVICAPLNPAYTTDELIHGLTITKPKHVICSEKVLKTVQNAVKRCPFVKEVIVFADVLPTDVNISNCRMTLFSDLLKPLHPSSRVDDFIPHSFQDSQTALILCSSGTTGLPKGVALSHGNIKGCIRINKNRSALYFGDQEVELALLPLYHGYGFLLLYHSIMQGITLVLLQKFEERLFLSTIEKYKISVLPMVPPLMVFLAKSDLVNKYDLSSVKHIFCGAAPIGENTIKEVKRRLGVETIRQGYGMTELSIAVIVTPPDADVSTNTIGKLVEGIEAKVIDIETGKSLGPNKVGELCFRGPCVMQGYVNNKKATEETIDKQGWLHTGDVGYYNKDEFFFIVDRIKELIKYKGYQVAPAELEAVLLTHPDVKDAAVIGIPDAMSGELPKAFIVKQPGSIITEKEIIKFIAEKVSSQKRLRGGVEFIEAIPKNPSGKILRRHLRDGYKSRL